MATKIVRIDFSVPANQAAGGRLPGVIYDLTSNPTAGLNQLVLSGQWTLSKAFIAASPSQANLNFYIINQEGNRLSLGTENIISMTTTFNPAIMKQLLLKGGAYTFEAVTTQPAGASAVTVSLFLELVQ